MTPDPADTGRAGLNDLTISSSHPVHPTGLARYVDPLTAEELDAAATDPEPDKGMPSDANSLPRAE